LRPLVRPRDPFRTRELGDAPASGVPRHARAAAFTRRLSRARRIRPCHTRILGDHIPAIGLEAAERLRSRLWRPPITPPQRFHWKSSSNRHSLPLDMHPCARFSHRTQGRVFRNPPVPDLSGFLLGARALPSRASPRTAQPLPSLRELSCTGDATIVRSDGKAQSSLQTTYRVYENAKSLAGDG
jgi:hypothetical protein